MTHSEESVLDALDQVIKCVVNVSTVRIYKDMFYRPVPVEGMGSGIIIDADGYILTNKHVISDAEEIRVTFTDGNMNKGNVIGTSAINDIAIIKVKEKKLPVPTLGELKNMRIGQKVYAIGNPFGLAGGPTVTSGVISSLNRSIKTKEGMVTNLLQTDAAINPGNSGGPLVDSKGNVIAINTAIIPFAQGIGFAIPINLAKKLANEIITYGKVSTPWLGIEGVSITPEIASYYDLPTKQGVLITKVIQASPAKQTGLSPKDILLRLDAQQIRTFETLQDEIKKRTAGDVVEIQILRDNKKLSLKAKLKRVP